MFCALALLSSCAAFDGTKRLKDPATVDIMDAKGGVISQAITSDRRLVIYRGDVICPEAPPDTASNISASYSGALDASLGAASNEAAAGIKAAFADQLATALNHITNPSQGILFMRFAMAAACNAYMNHAITTDQYFQFITQTFQASVAMTMFELEKNKGQVGNNVVASQQTAPTLSGAVVSVATAAKAATDAAQTNASAAGKPAAAEAGKQAGDAVKQQSPANASVDNLATTAGQAAHDAVLDTTADKAKADKARVDAMKRVFQSAAAAAPAVPIIATTSSNAAFSAALTQATKPLAELSENFATTKGDAASASKFERAAFEALLDKNLDAAIGALDRAYAAYPTFHQVDEIRALVKDRQGALKGGTDAQWRALYSTIVTKYSWHAPSDLLARMTERVGN